MLPRLPNRIRLIRRQYPRLPGETNVDYAFRLGRNDVEVDDAVLTALGRMEMDKVESCRFHLVFQSSEVRRRIARIHYLGITAKQMTDISDDWAWPI